ncbi:MAG: HNH endonuclease signature motif containing protein, partial [Gammaproteobacteria bacterium]|nr:HNH endonuclease signature motif containing protein [Gammaproteobacteria bacterium]
KFPGCEQTCFVDAHHIRHWAHGGETNLENLVQLCRFHHGQLHEGGYAIEGAGKNVRFMDPQGVEIPPVDDDLSCGPSRFCSKALPRKRL